MGRWKWEWKKWRRTEQMCLLKDCMSRVGEADTPGRLRTLESKILARIASEVKSTLNSHFLS